MNTRILSMARRHYVRPEVPRSTQRHNITQWARAVRYLGQRWLIAQPVELNKEGSQ